MDFVDTDKTALRHGDLRQHGHKRGDARRPEGRRSHCGKIFSTWPASFPASPVEQCRLEDGQVRCGDRSLSLQQLYAAAPLRDKLHVSRKVYGSPRSTAFLAHGFRIAVHRVTGEIRILQSVHAYDAGKIINPMQARGQVEGGIAQGIGTTLFERMVIDATRRRRESHLPELPHSGLCRHPPVRDLLRRHPRPLWSRSARSRSARLPSFPSPRPWVTRSPTRRAFASTACPSAPTGFFRAWPSWNKTRNPGETHEFRTRPIVPVVPMDIRGARVSTVVVQRVPADRVQRFLECQRGLTQAAEGFPGYQGTELYPPADDRHQEWVAVIHFDDQESLQRWIDSPVRAEWIKKLRDEIGDFQLKTLPSGFGAWFAGLETGPEGEPPPSWKIAMTVLLGLYPTVMLLALLVGRYLSPLGMAVSMLISNTLSVAITPVGRDTAADERAWPLAPCECARQEGSFDRRACPDLAPPWGPRGPVPRGDGVEAFAHATSEVFEASEVFPIRMLVQKEKWTT